MWILTRRTSDGFDLISKNADIRLLFDIVKSNNWNVIYDPAWDRGNIHFICTVRSEQSVESYTIKHE